MQRRPDDAVLSAKSPPPDNSKVHRRCQAQTTQRMPSRPRHAETDVVLVHQSVDARRATCSTNASCFVAHRSRLAPPPPSRTRAQRHATPSRSRSHDPGSRRRTACMTASAAGGPRTTQRGTYARTHVRPGTPAHHAPRAGTRRRAPTPSACSAPGAAAARTPRAHARRPIRGVRTLHAVRTACGARCAGQDPGGGGP